MLFGLWGAQFAMSPVSPGPGFWGLVASHIHWWVTVAYLLWAAIATARMFLGQRHPEAFRLFLKMWRTHIRPRGRDKIRS